MSTAGGALGAEVLATGPAIQSSEMPDYSHVPPAAGEYAPSEPLNTVNNLSNIQNIASPPANNEWDYGRQGGADFNMEAPILEEDVIRAGGLGARDDLDSFLPVAVDATDYEESLMDAMEYEDVPAEKEGDIPRPGVGFVKAQQQEMDGFREV